MTLTFQWLLLAVNSWCYSICMTLSFIRSTHLIQFYSLLWKEFAEKFGIKTIGKTHCNKNNKKLFFLNYVTKVPFFAWRNSYVDAHATSTNNNCKLKQLNHNYRILWVCTPFNPERSSTLRFFLNTNNCYIYVCACTFSLFYSESPSKHVSDACPLFASHWVW